MLFQNMVYLPIGMISNTMDKNSIHETEPVMQSTKIPAFGGKGYQSMRNNDFTPEAAIAEVIDNSIEADAKNIKIRILSKVPAGKINPRPYLIAFGDDGRGMNEETLQYCLRVGFSSAYNLRKGIGRFGVGMTYAAIRVCEFVEVYSREKQGKWLYTNLDIQDRQDNQNPGIEPIIEKKLPEEFKDLVGDQGTLAIWRNIDRIESDFNIEYLKHWLGRTYRKFIGKKIIVNGKVVDNPNVRKIIMDDGKNTDEITAFDPLYVIPNPKRPTDKTATYLEEQSFEFAVSEVDAPLSGQKLGKITIRTSLTPEEWRSKGGGADGNEPENKEAGRWVHENEGFSILRAGREVSYDKIPNFEPKLQDFDRWWSCEIEFEAVLDHQFSVKNIKVGARPLKELREDLQKTLSPIIKNNFRKKIDDNWAKSKIKKNQSFTGSINKHTDVEKKAANITKPKKSKLSAKELKKAGEVVADQKGLDIEEKEAFLKKLLDPNSPPFIIEEDVNGRPDGHFIDIVPNLGKKVVFYNLNHAFFKSIYDKLKTVQEIGEKTNPKDHELIDVANEMKLDIDQLIFAYADSKYELETPDIPQNISHTLDDLLSIWSQQLRKIYRSQNS